MARFTMPWRKNCAYKKSLRERRGGDGCTNLAVEYSAGFFGGLSADGSAAVSQRYVGGRRPDRPRAGDCARTTRRLLSFGHAMSVRQERSGAAADRLSNSCVSVGM